MSESWKQEVDEGSRFSFGANWKSFLETLTDERIAIAEQSLKDMLAVSDLKTKTFLDIGCGSGLFSLCAVRLGASVVSLDYDPQSVECARFLKDRYTDADDERWNIREGSILDTSLIDVLGKFDIVYSWGVLHHTGRMYDALDNASKFVKNGGTLFISIYNDQGKASRRWLSVKRLYNWLPLPGKWLMMIVFIVRFTAIGTIKEILLLRPFREWREYKKSRGMSRIQNIRDWIGGLPFEVAKPEDIFHFYRDRGFELRNLVTCAGGIGCNEYVLVKM